MAFRICVLFACIFLFTIALPVLSRRNIERVERSSSPFDFLKNLQGCQKGEKIQGLHNLKTYLEKFGYLNHSNSNSDDFDEALESAMKTYQVNYNLKPTGTFDADTVSKMMTPRCGVPDIINGTTTRMHTSHYNNDHGSISIDIVSNYVFFPGSPRWPASKTQLTYAFEANVDSAAFDPVGRAFGMWSQATQFSFTRVQSTASADLVIGFHRGVHGDGYPFDGPGGILAHSFAPTDGRFHYDADERFSVGAVNGEFDLQTVALHEIGHLLGLGHSSFQNAIMYPTIEPGTTKGLDTDDIDGIRALYGS